MECADRIKDENFLSSICDGRPELLNECIDINWIFGENVEHWKSRHFRQTSVTEMNDAFGLDMRCSDLKGIVIYFVVAHLSF